MRCSADHDSVDMRPDLTLLEVVLSHGLQSMRQHFRVHGQLWYST